MSSILWISSMSLPLYNFYGKDFIQSFKKYQPGSSLWITLDTPINDLKTDNLIKSYNLTDSKLYHKFIKYNRDRIPINDGGCMSSVELKKINKYNTRWFGWYKKVLSLFIGLEEFSFHKQYQMIIWIDCDCLIQQHIPDSYLFSLLNQKSLAYYYGPFRKKKKMGVESGLVLFNVQKKGVDFIHQWHNIYWKQNYINYNRWDDGYLLFVLIYKLLDKKDREDTIDLGTKTKNIDDSHVMKGCDIWNKIIHQKGSKSGIFK